MPALTVSPTWDDTSVTWGDASILWDGWKPLSVTTAAAIGQSFLVLTQPTVSSTASLLVNRYLTASATVPVSPSVVVSPTITVITLVPVTPTGPYASMTAYTMPVISSTASFTLTRPSVSNRTTTDVATSAAAYVSVKQTFFEGPSYVSRRDDELWLIKNQLGITLYQKQDGSWVQTTSPIDSDLAAAQRVYRGGYSYPLTDADVTALTAAGYGSYIVTRYVRI